MLCGGALLLAVAAIPVPAQMTPEQRLSRFHRRWLPSMRSPYAPANWKQQSIGVNIFAAEVVGGSGSRGEDRY